MMKRKLLVMLLVGVMALSALTACGGKKGEEAPAEPNVDVEEDIEAEAATDEAAEEAATDEMMSDETFAGLQESYAAMEEAYNAVLELYSAEEIAANADIETALTEVKAVMDEMGELSQEEMTEADAGVLAQSMLDLLETMDALIEGMEVVEEDAAEGDFTLLDVTSDMIDAAIYVGDEESELVLSLFTIPDGTPMCSMLEYSPSAETGDIACGAYTAETETDADGIAWTYLTFEDVYEGKTFEMGFGESDAGECYLVLPSGDIYEAQYLNQEEAIAYMGTAVALLSE